MHKRAAFAVIVGSVVSVMMAASVAAEVMGRKARERAEVASGVTPGDLGSGSSSAAREESAAGGGSDGSSVDGAGSADGGDASASRLAESSVIDAIVPSPGAAALVGFAMLAVRRRRG